MFCLFISVSVFRTNNVTYYYTNMLREAFVTSKTDDRDTFNDIAQSNGEDFWKVNVFLEYFSN